MDSCIDLKQKILLLFATLCMMCNLQDRTEAVLVDKPGHAKVRILLDDCVTWMLLYLIHLCPLSFRRLASQVYKVGLMRR